MKKAAEFAKTLVVICKHGELAFDPVALGWYFKPDGSTEAMEVHLERYATASNDTMRVLLRSHEYRLITGDWQRQVVSTQGKYSLIAWSIRKLLTQYESLKEAEKILRTVARGGYQLSEAHIGNIPDWVPKAIQNDGEIALQARTEDEQMDLLPNYRWIPELAAAVNQGRWVQITALPGNGAEEIDSILANRCPQTCVIPIDLAYIDDSTSLIDTILPSRITETSGTNGRIDYHRIARDAAGPKSSITLVLKGFGSFLHDNHTDEEFSDLFMVLKGFGVVRPKPTFVAVTPISLHHFPHSFAVNSFFGAFDNIRPSTLDVSDFDSWANLCMSDLQQSEQAAILREARAQFRAVKWALSPPTKTSQERMMSIKDAHAKAARAIQAAIPPCCLDFLTSGMDKCNCGDALVVAGILARKGGKYLPLIDDWLNVWNEDVRRKGRL